MFKDNLIYIEKELTKIYKTDIMQIAVEDRLNASLYKYVQNLDETTRYLLSQSAKVQLKFLKK